MLIALLAGFGLGFGGSIPIAGPTAVVVVESALDQRPRDGMLVAIGAGVAESIYALFAFWGLATVFTRYPLLLPASRALGAAVLILVGIYFLRRKSPQQETHAVPNVRQHKHRILFGFTITALNPTLAVTWTAAIAALHAAVTSRFAPFDAVPFGVGALVGIVSWFWLLLKLVRRFRAHLQPATMNRVVRGMGGALVMLGVLLAGRTLLLPH
jgi:threonine/homoserine/homoserine lactone efflux protein